MFLLSEYIGNGTINNPYRPAFAAHFTDWSDLTGTNDPTNLVLGAVKNHTQAQENNAQNDSKVFLLEKADRAALRAYIKGKKGLSDSAANSIIQDEVDADLGTVVDDLKHYLKNGKIPPDRKKPKP